MTQGWKPPAVTDRFSSLFFVLFICFSCLFFVCFLDRFLTSAEETVSYCSLYRLLFTMFVCDFC